MELSYLKREREGEKELRIEYLKRAESAEAQVTALQQERDRDVQMYLKDGETVAECIARNRADVDTTLGLLASALARAEAAEQQLRESQ